MKWSPMPKVSSKSKSNTNVELSKLVLEISNNLDIDPFSYKKDGSFHMDAWWADVLKQLPDEVIAPFITDDPEIKSDCVLAKMMQATQDELDRRSFVIKEPSYTLKALIHKGF